MKIFEKHSNLNLVRTRDGPRVPLLVAERALCADERAALQAVPETGNTELSTVYQYCIVCCVITSFDYCILRTYTART